MSYADSKLIISSCFEVFDGLVLVRSLKFYKKLLVKPTPCCNNCPPRSTSAGTSSICVSGTVSGSDYGSAGCGFV